MNEPRKAAPYNILIPPDLDDDCRAHAARRGLSRAAIIKIALRAYLQHQVKNAPTCADGTPCLCPVMWQRNGIGPSLET